MDVIKCLTIISLTNSKKDEQDMRKILKNKIESSKFVLILYVFVKIF